MEDRDCLETISMQRARFAVIDDENACRKLKEHQQWRWTKVGCIPVVFLIMQRALSS
jgi:hypothetical protein